MNPSSTLKTIMFWLFIIMLAVLLWTLVSKSGQSAREEEPSYSEFMAQVDRGNVKEVTLYLSPTSYEIEGEWREPSKKFRTTIFKESAPDLAKTLRDKQVLINVKEVNRADWVTFLLNAAPLFLLVPLVIVLWCGHSKGTHWRHQRNRQKQRSDILVSTLHSYPPGPTRMMPGAPRLELIAEDAPPHI